MGWWTTSAGVIGDQSADVASRGLAALSEELVARRGRRLGLDELLGYLDLVLRTKAPDLLAPGEPSGSSGIHAELEVVDEGHRVAIAMAAPTDDTIRDRIDAMCAAISRQYEASLDRRPTRSELLGSIRFVLGHHADRLLDLPAGSSVLGIS